MKKKIVFFVQTKKPIGGSQILFLDMAAYVAEHYDCETYYINYRHPIVEERYMDSKIKFLDVDECDYSQLEDAIFFTPINYIFYLLAKISKYPKTKICTYFYHPHVFSWLQNQLFNRKKPMKDLLDVLVATNSCCFMDKSNYVAAQKLKKGISFKEQYFPVSLHDETFSVPTFSNELIKPGEINIGWLGRLDRDKIYSIINMADNLLANNFEQHIRIHLLGDGNSRNLIRLNKYAPNISFVFTSYMYGEERDKYMLEHVDLVMAMGISAIDAAILGIPTVVPIVSPSPFRDDKFVYVHDVLGYSLGWDRENIKDTCREYYDIESVINDIYVNNKKGELGKIGYEFCIENFSLDNAAKLILESIDSTELTVAKCKRCGTIKTFMSQYNLYKAIRPNRDFLFFHEFTARYNGINRYKGLKKLSFIKQEIKKTFKKDRSGK